MIEVEKLSCFEVADSLARLASLLPQDLEEMLLDLAVSAENVREVASAAHGVENIITPQAAIAFAFERSPIPEQRFNTAAEHVLYAALEIETALAEIRYWCGVSLAQKGHFAGRYYQLLRIAFSGQMLDLRGREGDHPELISENESGYPFCRELASRARGLPVDALYTRSARDNAGTCVPVFSRSAVDESGIRVEGLFRFFLNAGAIELERAA